MEIKQTGVRSKDFTDSLEEGLHQGEAFTELRCIVPKRHFKTYMIFTHFDSNTGEWLVTNYWGAIGKKVASQEKYRGREKSLAEKEAQKWQRKKMQGHGDSQYTLHNHFEYEDQLKARTMIKSLEIQVGGLREIAKGKSATFTEENGETRFAYLEV